MNASETANVARFVSMRAEDQPEACAILAPKGRCKSGDIDYEQLGFRELHAQSEQVAFGLKQAGVAKGTRVLLMVRPGSDLIRCCFALFKLGAVPVVIDPGMGLRSFLSCVRRTRPEVLLGIPLALWIRRFMPGPFSSVQGTRSVGRGFGRWYRAFPEKGFPLAEAKPDDLAAILFTSGSTGPPKGVCYGHGQFDAQVDLIRETFSIEPGEVDLPMLPVFSLFNPALGMTTVVPEINPGKPAAVQPARILQAIHQCSVTNSFGSPVLWRKIGDYAARTGQRFPKMRRILMAGAPVPPDLLRRLSPVFPNARLWSPYGATECLPVSAVEAREVLEDTASKTASGAGTCVGRPVAGVRVRIIPVSPDPIRFLSDCPEVPSGTIGEIIATGPTVTKSYDALPEATTRAKITDDSCGDRHHMEADSRGVRPRMDVKKEGICGVWHRMGDAGYLDADGRLWFCGRLAERVITELETFYTDCCEGIFNAMPGVRRSALIGLGLPPAQTPAIVIDPDPDNPPTPAQILSRAAEFPGTKAIQQVFFTSAFPVDVRHNAKIHRLSLARRFMKGQAPHKKNQSRDR